MSTAASAGTPDDAERMTAREAVVHKGRNVGHLAEAVISRSLSIKYKVYIYIYDYVNTM